jgi:hypothetical protein
MAEGERFSRRHGLTRRHNGPLLYHSAPERLRVGTLSLLHNEMNKSPRWIRETICNVCRVRPDPNNWSHPNIWQEAEGLVYRAEWFEFYDFVESCAEAERSGHGLDGFETSINRLFEEEHVGWRLTNGVLEVHGEDSLEDVLGTPEEELDQSGFAVAAKEFREARTDLSRRPEPDLSGAVQHAMAALESVARVFSGDSKLTLGQIIKAYPDLLPSPVNDAAAKLWGFASEQGRHGRESRRLEWAETLLIVGIAGTLCSYMIAKRAL